MKIHIMDICTISSTAGVTVICQPWTGSTGKGYIGTSLTPTPLEP